MQIIIPLAGPDFVLGPGRTKVEMTVEGLPLLRAALESRPWWRSGAAGPADLVFVLHDDAESRRAAAGPLAAWYPGARRVMLSTWTAGAALSALAGIALVAAAEEPICLDLVDILYDVADTPELHFDDPKVGGVALVFPSDNPVYSYLRTDAAGQVVEAAEKRVISNHASAGTYLFRSPVVMLRALADSLDRRDAVTHRGLFFVCPLFNGVLAQGFAVRLVGVDRVRDIKISKSAPSR